MNPNNPCGGIYGKCLDIKIINECNGKCAFCIEKGGYSPKETSVQQLLDAANTLVDYRKVLILGGEPFLYKNLSKFILNLEKDEIFITTNGSAFTDEVVKEISPKLTGINISLHHFSQLKNKEIMGIENDYLYLKHFIDIFKFYEVNVRINTNLMKNGIINNSDAEKMIMHAHYLGADQIRFAELQNCPDLFIDAKTIFGKVNENPYIDGCEIKLNEYKEIDVFLRLTCGKVNPLKKKIEENENHSKTKIIYPSAEVKTSWASNGPSCHNAASFIRGCH
jgi:organic radical activating enzyme